MMLLFTVLPQPPCSRCFRAALRQESSATTPRKYLSELTSNGRKAIVAVCDTIWAHLSKGHIESISFGLIAYVIPNTLYPDTYNGEPLMYVALATQKTYGGLPL